MTLSLCEELKKSLCQIILYLELNLCRTLLQDRFWSVLQLMVATSWITLVPALGLVPIVIRGSVLHNYPARIPSRRVISSTSRTHTRLQDKSHENRTLSCRLCPANEPVSEKWHRGFIRMDVLNDFQMIPDMHGEFPLSKKY